MSGALPPLPKAFMARKGKISLQRSGRIREPPAHAENLYLLKHVSLRSTSENDEYGGLRPGKDFSISHIPIRIINK